MEHHYVPNIHPGRGELLFIPVMSILLGISASLHTTCCAQQCGEARAVEWWSEPVNHNLKDQLVAIILVEPSTGGAYLILPHLIRLLSAHVFSAVLRSLGFNFVPDLLRLLCTRVCFVPEVKHEVYFCAGYMLCYS